MFTQEDLERLHRNGAPKMTRERLHEMWRQASAGNGFVQLRCSEGEFFQVVALAGLAVAGAPAFSTSGNLTALPHEPGCLLLCGTAGCQCTCGVAEKERERARVATVTIRHGGRLPPRTVTLEESEDAKAIREAVHEYFLGDIPPALQRAMNGEPPAPSEGYTCVKCEHLGAHCPEHGHPEPHPGPTTEELDAIPPELVQRALDKADARDSVIELAKNAVRAFDDYQKYGPAGVAYLCLVREMGRLKEAVGKLGGA